jgi:hypothetical protein
MKKILLFLLVAGLSLSGFGQAEPGLGGFFFTNATGGTSSASASSLLIGTQYRVNLPVSNLAPNPVPTGGTGITISLGPNLQFVGAGVVTTTASSWYSWTISTNPTTGQQIVGTQIAPIPAFADEQLTFQVVAVSQTPASGSDLIANLGTNPPFLDIQPGNNTSRLTYFTQSVLPVKFVSIDASNVNCTVNVSWKVAEEVNVSHYEVLVSNNGAGFRSVANANVNSSNGGAYASSFAIPADLKGQVLFVQVKEVDNDGKFTLSNVKTVRGNCDNARQLIVYAYPNPVVSTNYINVAAKEGVFEGKYKLELLDNNGKLYQVKEVELNNAVSVPFEFRSTLSPGKYMIRVSNLDGSQTSTVQFIKVGGVL